MNTVILKPPFMIHVIAKYCHDNCIIYSRQAVNGLVRLPLKLDGRIRVHIWQTAHPFLQRTRNNINHLVMRVRRLQCARLNT